MDDNPVLRDEVKNLISTGTFPWENFVWTASNHLVLPALFTAFRRNGLLPLLPEDLQQHLQYIYGLNLARNRKISDQCREMASLLNPGNIEPIFMKGAGFLFSEMYHDPGDRIMEDIDILLPENSIPAALKKFPELRYVSDERNQDEEDYGSHHHFPPLIAPGKAAPVEIHRSPVHRDYRMLISADDLLNHPVRTGPGYILIPDVRESQILIFLHENRAGRGYLSSTGSLKGWYDFYLLSKLRKPDPSDIQRKRFRKKYLQFCYSVGKVFNNRELMGQPESSFLRRYWKRQLFLIDHPGWDTRWHDYVYATFVFIKLLIRSVGSERARNLIRLKIRKFTARKSNRGIRQE